MDFDQGYREVEPTISTEVSGCPIGRWWCGPWGCSAAIVGSTGPFARIGRKG